MPRLAVLARTHASSRLGRLGTALTAAVLLTLGGARTASARGATFVAAREPLGEVLARARALDASRLVVVELFTEDCAWCRVLERETFGSEGVEAALRDDVCVRYDADSPVGRPVAERFGVGSFPTTLFLDPAGEEIDRLVGYVPAQRFVDETARIRAGTRTLKALRVAHAAKPGDAALAVAFARKLARAGDLGAARRLLEPVVDATPPDESVLPAALVGLAELAHREGDARRCDECLDRLLVAYPDAPDAADGWLLRIDRLAHVGAFERAAEAAATARRVVKDDEKLASLEERLATFERLKFQATLVRWGERADASGDLESLARAAKMALDRRLVLGTARRWAERVAKAAPGDADALEVYAELLFETGSVEKAIRTAAEARDAAQDADVRARLSRRAATWRAALEVPPPAAPSAPDPAIDEGPEPSPDAPPARPAALPRPPDDRVPTPTPTEPRTGSTPAPSPSPSPSPTEPKPPCR